MNSILLAIIVVTAIGLICAIMLVAASKIFRVRTDERILKIRECLPGANCGACGYAGCDGYATALVEDEDVRTNLCIPGGTDVAKQIAEVLGVEAETVGHMVAAVHCRGINTVTDDKMDYDGIRTCKATRLTFNGKGLCPHGCVGFGDCEKVCPQNAICMENGVAQIDGRICIGCGLCAKTCPSHIIEMIPVGSTVIVSCSNQEKGAAARQHCKNACIGCMKCTKVCAFEAITVKDNLATIDYTKCTGCAQCSQVCPTGAIVRRP